MGEKKKKKKTTADCSDLAIQIQNSKTKIYIASFQVAQPQSHLKGDYVNFGFAVLDFMLQDHCNLLYLEKHDNCLAGISAYMVEHHCPALMTL